MRIKTGRIGVGGLVWGSVLTLAAGCASTAQDRSHSATMTPDSQAALTPEQVIDDLRAGNERFVSSRGVTRDLTAQVRATASAQYPKAFVLGCVDSRVPPEVVFDQGIGDIFVGRVAGNVENRDLLGSMEFATQVAGSKAIVVLGHTSCGAVQGAVSGVELGNLTGLLGEIEPVVDRVPTGAQGRTAQNAAYVDSVAEENVRATVRDVLSGSEVIAGLVDRGEVAIVGALYDTTTGSVRWLD